MRKTIYLYGAEMALLAYLIITGIIITIQYSMLANAGMQLFFRILLVLLILFFGWFHANRKSSSILQLIRYSLPLLSLTYLYTETDTLNNFIFKDDLDPFISRLEENIFGLQPALVFSEQVSSNVFAELMYFGYFSYYLLLVIVPLYLYFKRNLIIANRSMFIIIFSFFIFYLIFIVFPVGGPQFYFADWPALPRGYVFGPIMRLIQQNGEAPTAAFPSSHVSICLMLIALCYLHARKLLKFILPVAFLLVLSTVYIRAHYLVDILAAFLITPPMYLFSEFVFSKIIQSTKPIQL